MYVGFLIFSAAAQRLKLLLSFAVGGLLGDVFLHLLPEAYSHVNPGKFLNLFLNSWRPRNRTVGNMVGELIGALVWQSPKGKTQGGQKLCTSRVVLPVADNIFKSQHDP